MNRTHSGILSSCMLHFNHVVSLAAFPASDNFKYNEKHLTSANLLQNFS